MALALTGTPFHRKPMMVYGIFKFIDDAVFNTSWAQFKNYFGKWAGYDNWKFVGVQNKSRAAWQDEASDLHDEDPSPCSPATRSSSLQTRGEREESMSRWQRRVHRSY
jgi:hypothetical protein